MKAKSKSVQKQRVVNYGNYVIAEIRGSKNDQITEEIINSIVNDVLQFNYDSEYGWVMVPNPPYAEFGLDEMAYIIRGEITNLNWKYLKEHPSVVKVYRDTPIQPAVCNCSAYETNDWIPVIKDVRKHLGVDEIWKNGFRGKGIVVGVVDSGIKIEKKSSESNGLFNNVNDGFSHNSSWGNRSDWNEHGNMVAYDILGIAPDVKLYDIRITELYQPDRISLVVKAYRWAIDHFKTDGTPHILNNSWAIYNKQFDKSYAYGKDHLFTRTVQEAIELGIKVLFAAGNCGCNCSLFEDRCKGDIGAEKGIWGANGHPDVMTVAAISLKKEKKQYIEEYINYSSKGPAALHGEKPDFCAISHYKGYNRGLFEKGGGNYCDTGTSAACPVVSGIVALLLQVESNLSQQEIKQCLSSTASPLSLNWNNKTGHGTVRAKSAFDLISLK